MSDPKRLLESLQDETDLGRLLAAGKREIPDDAQLAALATKIGIAGGLVAGGAAGATGAATGGTGATKIAVGTTAAKAAVAIKIGGALVVAGTAVASAVVLSRTDDAPRAPVGLASSVAASSAAGTAERTAAATPPVVDDTSSVPSAATTAQATPPSSATTRATPARSATAEGPEVEVRLLERAQDALRSQPEEALRLADDHARRFPTGMLAQEREVIAVEALVKTGRIAEAKARAARFESRFPGSSHTRRLRALVGE